jgi:hypothetical protein
MQPLASLIHLDVDVDVALHNALIIYRRDPHKTWYTFLTNAAMHLCQPHVTRRMSGSDLTPRKVMEAARFCCAEHRVTFFLEVNSTNV